MQIVQTTLAELVPGAHQRAAQCFCHLAHPQSAAEEHQLHTEVQEALHLGDAHGVYLGMLRLLTAPNCPARTNGARRG